MLFCLFIINDRFYLEERATEETKYDRQLCSFLGTCFVSRIFEDLLQTKINKKKCVRFFLIHIKRMFGVG